MVTLEPKQALFRAGSRQEVRCSVAGCPHKVTLHWGWVEDRPLGARVSSTPTSLVATFDPVTPEHGGVLLCRAICGAELRATQARLQVYCESSSTTGWLYRSGSGSIGLGL